MVVFGRAIWFIMRVENSVAQGLDYDSPAFTFFTPTHPNEAIKASEFQGRGAADTPIGGMTAPLEHRGKFGAA